MKVEIEIPDELVSVFTDVLETIKKTAETVKTETENVVKETKTTFKPGASDAFNGLFGDLTKVFDQIFDEQMTARETETKETREDFDRKEMIRRCQGITQDISGIDKTASISFNNTVGTKNILNELIMHDNASALTDSDIVIFAMKDGIEGDYFWSYIAEKIIRMRG